ncbi:MAG: electron transfer flavoprotein subunit alpha/FixB family protein [Gammaproteobacteria bacterium]|nr:electron transfer flavoprotein subunit alpha/FixB family protein [Gammaproteobacteria bacterium]MYD76040.1 electron transfer flavoprotein subunit alpha/FixB family protein [Gammaproteobacteria bacterium]MYJ53252.1 electron transfer flavoprotein subunit alpha/FixB family protein [Gammaproteobacteria bacterium]
MSILVIAECDKNALALSTLNTVTAAGQIGGKVDLLVTGHDCSDLAQSASAIAGVDRVLCCDSPDHEHHVTENVAALIESLSGHYTHVMAPATTFGKALIPYVAALCDVQAISDISEIVDADTFVRPIYAGNALAKVRSADPLKMITVRATAFESAPNEGGSATVESVESPGANGHLQFMEQMLSASERPELTSAKVVVSGGRGMKSGENFGMLESLADRLGGAVGASRAAVDAGFVPNDYQVGQTGKVVAPDLYIAVGISGAIQHLAGMKDSKIIVAINTDEDAPIFQVSDYGWNEDLFTAIPQLNAELES